MKKETSHLNGVFEVSKCTCVSVAPVSVHRQIGQVCVWVLVWWSGHYKMNQTSCFADCGDSFGVRHTCHYFIIDLLKKKVIKSVRSVRSELLSSELLRKSSLTFSSLSPTCSLFEVSAIPPGVMDLTNIPLSPPITEKPRPPEGGFSRSTVTISSCIIKRINFLQCKITIKKMHVCVYSLLLNN